MAEILYSRQIASSGGKLKPNWRHLTQTNHQVAQSSRLSAQMSPTGFNLESNDRVMAQTGAIFWSKPGGIWRRSYGTQFITFGDTCRTDINSAPERATTRQSQNLWRKLAPNGAG